MKKIGIMGGTFNPIHNAHVRMAQAAYEQYGLDEVWFMPSRNPPHKDGRHIVSEEHRARMVRAAIDPIPYFLYSDLELTRGGTTYTCKTMKILQKEYPEAELYFILGGDSLLHFRDWHHPRKIVKRCTILAVPRGGISGDKLNHLCKKQAKRFDGTFLPVSMEHMPISSEQVRDKIQCGESPLALCPEAVATYISLHGLYGAEEERLNIQGACRELLQGLSATLRPGRYLHTLRVAGTAAALAFCHCRVPGRDAERAELAGLLHDCAKYLTGAEMLALCQKYGIALSEVEQRNTALVHGKLGAWLAASRYGIRDKEICSAISYHTTGRPGMTMLEKILYVADYIEPGRNMDCSPYPLDAIRQESFQNLDGALRMILANTVEYLRADAGREIDELTSRTYEYYKGSGAESAHGEQLQNE